MPAHSAIKCLPPMLSVNLNLHVIFIKFKIYSERCNVQEKKLILMHVTISKVYLLRIFFKLYTSSLAVTLSVPVQLVFPLHLFNI